MTSSTSPNRRCRFFTSCGSKVPSRSRGTSNQYWLGSLAKAQTDPRIAAQFRSLVPDLEAVTPADLQKVASRYLAASKAWKLVVVPDGTTPAQPSSGAPAAR